MSKLEELVALQTQLMMSITRSLANFKKLGQAKMTEAVTKNRLSNLTDTFRRCQDIDGQINLLADERIRASLAYFKGEQFLACEENYYEATDFMAEILSSSAHSDHNTSLDGSHRCDKSQSSAYLPRINLPTFDGSFDKWEGFRDKFKALILSDSGLSDVKRFHYLISCLKGDATHALDDIDLTEANFSIAWNRLISRYENKRKLVAFRLHALLNLPAAAAETAHNLRELREHTNKILHSLKNLDRPVQHWDDIVVYLVTQKLDKATKKAWELHLGKSLEYPKYSELNDFLESRICGLDSALIENPKDSARSTRSKPISSHVAASINPECPVCKSSHFLQYCSTFLSQTPSQRYETTRKLKRCVNCLSGKHVAVKDCTSKRVCKQCSKKHHTLLHFEAKKGNDAELTETHNNSIETVETEVASHLVSKSAALKTKIILATARVRIYCPQGRHVTVRALLDQGSVSTLISESLAQMLHLPRTRLSLQISGIDNTQSTVRHAVELRLSPTSTNEPTYSVTALVVNSITRYTPTPIAKTRTWPHLNDLALADPDLFSQDPIGMIIGADLFGQLLRNGIRRGSDDEPVAQNTVLGWIISGPTTSIERRVSSSTSVHHGLIEDTLESRLRRFWELEEVPSRSHRDSAEAQCDEHFAKTHRRDLDGRYIVRLPFKNGPPRPLGESRGIALANLRRMEQSVERDPLHAAEYRNFMREYENLGHMAQIKIDKVGHDSNHYYIPHHSVRRESSSTTKLRVVFNAASKTSTGSSLNDQLLIGPKLQNDLPTIILKWRQHRYVYTSDIAKMYRQIWVDPRDLDFQRILWRPSPNDPIADYQLLTVTYGTASAPYLALRVLKQLASDEGKSFPLACPVLEHCIYVDDCVFGADDKALARQTRDQLIDLLARGGFPLRKWASNCPDLIADLDPDDHGLACDKSLQEDESLTVLGIVWNPRRDIMAFRVAVPSSVGSTKRAILSTIARLYDPLGWASPVVVTAKIFMQQLWLLKCSWDDPLPQQALETWRTYAFALADLSNATLPRWTHFGSNVVHCALHGFSDASTKAYAACIYLRVVNADGSVITSLLMAKSRVAPIKTLSVPRLELSGALLLAQLMHYVKGALTMTNVEYHCWTDSTITLAWLTRPPCHWKTFVANRVSNIQGLCPRNVWHHVASADNPADCASRGILPSELIAHRLWWHGPAWLELASDHWPDDCPPPTNESLLEPRAPITILNSVVQSRWDLDSRVSSWSRLLRITAYIFRFIRKLRGARAPHSNETEESGRGLLPRNIQEAKHYWIRTLQSEAFAAEMALLSRDQHIAKTSALCSLNPYLDSKGLLRVGGRLRHAALPDEVKHPLIIKSHPIATLIIRQHHLTTLHAGTKLTLASLRQEYWLLRARTTVRAVLHQCVQCTRELSTHSTELMGDLPDTRVNRSARAFDHTGIDYAGPFVLRTANGRGSKTRKAYLAVFVCLTVKAVHLELVSEYTTAAFLAAYHRFVSRRGLPSSIYSDNGTNFRGADRELINAYREAIRDSTFINMLATKQVQWHFMPPHAPHFGGLWEACVKSVKHHLRRCIGKNTLTFEEMTTFLCRVEACLNSRPIGPNSDSLDDYTALTPGHFLVGTPLIASPEPSLLQLNENRLSRWQLIQRCTESFWRAWSTDYLHTLQQRPKWRVATRLARVGQIVLIQNPSAPPSHWELGRIIVCHSGEDGLTRVVTVKTHKSEYRRPITKLRFLPIDVNVAAACDKEKLSKPPSEDLDLAKAENAH